MIGISNKTIYAVAALYQLSLIETTERLKIKEIAQRANVPQKFLEQILLELKKSNLLHSIKGAKGGYSLAKPLSEITLAEVISILENNAFTDICRTNNPLLQLFWQEKQEALKELFNTPLSELKGYQKRITQNFNYII
jgi:Rrf2 family protein